MYSNSPSLSMGIEIIGTKNLSAFDVNISMGKSIESSNLVEVAIFCGRTKFKD
jgi:hypothetical protein